MRIRPIVTDEFRNERFSRNLGSTTYALRNDKGKGMSWEVYCLN